MKGDFSKWEIINWNLNGVLHQQGRVLHDRDWNDRERIMNQWQYRAARDIIGPSVLGIPAHTPDSLQVTNAQVVGNTIELKVIPGDGWADGLAVHLAGDPANPGTAIDRDAAYLPPPFNKSSITVVDITDNVRDAVVLEVWREALNAFQMPEHLIEPALGGVDTTERIHTGMRFSLLRLDKEDTCSNLTSKIQDDDSSKGRLTVTLEPTNVIAGVCPVVEGGGYVGFEHALYRVEIAETDSAPAMFKWSQFNGGLVGRGKFNAADEKFTITANDQAIKMSGLSEFYLEVVEWNEDQGYWRVTYGAEVTLNGDDLEVTTKRLVSPIPTKPDRVFFRLWNGIDKVSDYPVTAAPTDPQGLADGIRLEFGSGSYRPNDYWTFDVRAGEIANPDTLIDEQLPEGVEYHRVPVAILNWNAGQQISFANEEIDDCRDIFRPLTKQASCCTFSVGDGVNSFGDFNSVEEALHHLPSSGGEICLLPGRHETNTVIKDRENIKIKGCDKKTLVTPRQANSKKPIFTVIDSQGITFEHMDLVTFEGTAILSRGSQPHINQDIHIHHNRILAALRGIDMTHGKEVKIQHNIIRILDKKGGGVGVYLEAIDTLVERNNIGVIPAGSLPEPDPEDEDIPDDPTDPCDDPNTVYANVVYLVYYVAFVWKYIIPVFFPANPYSALGGIQIASGSENIKILENVINGGAGNGITLGSGLDHTEKISPETEESSEEKFRIGNKGKSILGWVTEDGIAVEGVTLLFTNLENDSTSTVVSDKGGYYFEKTDPGVYQIASTHPGYKIVKIETSQQEEFGIAPNIEVEAVEKEEIDILDFLAFIYEVSIDQNKISNMGLSGIGNPEPDIKLIKQLIEKGHFQKSLALLPILPRIAKLTGGLGGFVVDLEIYRNHIFNCFQNFGPESLGSTAESLLSKGVGGISLGMCQSLTIRENRIEENGRSHLDAVCGVYIGFADQVDISRNKVLNNGPLITKGIEYPTNIRSGRRGGIVLNLATSISFLRGNKQNEKYGVSSNNPAVRIHDNIVNQPAGQALFVQAYGPVSVMGNYFNSEISGTSKGDILAGAVLIINKGDSGVTARGAISLQRLKQKEYMEIYEVGDMDMPTEMAEGRSDTGGTNPAMLAPMNLTDLPAYRPPHSSGDIMFNDNQVRNGPLNLSNFAQAIIARASDISFSANQSQDLSRVQQKKDVSAGLKDMLARNANTLLRGATVRANSSRFEEPQIVITDVSAPFASLISISEYMNTTTLNQADHCIVTQNVSESTWPTVDTGNRVFNHRGCQERAGQIKNLIPPSERKYTDLLYLIR